MGNKIIVVFVQERETPNTIRYQEQVPDGSAEVIGTLYVKKSALVGIGTPDRLDVTISAG